MKHAWGFCSYSYSRDVLQGPEIISSDKYATAEAYYGLASAYANVPDLHIMWLLYLCEVHQGNQSYAEAAQCAVAVAGVIMHVCSSFLYKIA